MLYLEKYPAFLESLPKYFDTVIALDGKLDGLKYNAKDIGQHVFSEHTTYPTNREESLTV